MLIPFGILSAAGASVGVAGDYELIESKILSTATSSVEFTNLGTYSSTYKHLQIRFAARSSYGGNGESILMRLNGDTGNNYASHRLAGDGSTVFSTNVAPSVSTINVGFVASGTGSNTFSAGVIDLLDSYSTTKNKTVRSLNGLHITSGSHLVALNSGFRNNTASITSVSFITETASNFVAGTRFSIYGVR